MIAAAASPATSPGPNMVTGTGRGWSFTRSPTVLVKRAGAERLSAVAMAAAPPSRTKER